MVSKRKHFVPFHGIFFLVFEYFTWNPFIVSSLSNIENTFLASPNGMLSLFLLDTQLFSRFYFAQDKILRSIVYLELLSPRMKQNPEDSMHKYTNIGYFRSTNVIIAVFEIWTFYGLRKCVYVVNHRLVNTGSLFVIQPQKEEWRSLIYCPFAKWPEWIEKRHQNCVLSKQLWYCCRWFE